MILQNQISQNEDGYVIYITTDDGCIVEQDVDPVTGDSIITQERAEEIQQELIDSIVKARLPEVPYMISKNNIAPDEEITITVPVGTRAITGEFDVIVDDGQLVYSNGNVGEYQILLMLEGYRDTIVKVVVGQ